MEAAGAAAGMAVRLLEEALPQAVAALQVLVAPVVFAAFQIETPRNPSGTLCAWLSAGAAACTDLSFV